MTQESQKIDREAYACQLVGRFLQSFALVEQALDVGIGKLLDLSGARMDIMSSQLIIMAKLNVFFSAEGLLAALPEPDRKQSLKSAWSKVTSLNDHRKVFAHCPFSGTGDGVKFRRAVAGKSLKVTEPEYTTVMVDGLCADASRIVETLNSLVAEMKPYVATMDFRDPRNSGLIVAILL